MPTSANSPLAANPNLSKSEQLTQLANRLRQLVIQMIAVAESGHLASPIALSDLIALMYSYILRHNPHQPDDPKRDRFFLSAGHICPVLYAILAEFDYFPVEELFTLRQIGSRLQGHPQRQVAIGIENTSGPLGQGVSMAVGCALELSRQKLSQTDKAPRVYALCTDGEQQEGQVWEAYQFAAQHNLENFTVIIDVNDIQITGRTSEIMNQRDLAKKMKDFGFAVFKADGHSFNELAEAFLAAQKVTNQPQAIVIDTIAGRGISFMENDYRWHSHPLDWQKAQQALSELGVTDFSTSSDQLEPDFKTWFFAAQQKTNSTSTSNNSTLTSQKSTREGFGEAVTQLAPAHPELLVGCADLAESLHLLDFRKLYPHQYVEFGVAEQNLASACAGMAMNDRTVFAASFATFNPGRNWEQVRISICEQNLNVKLVGSHAGISTGPDGATHQALEDIAITRTLPHMTVIAPCDYLEAQKATTALIEKHVGPTYLRLSREKSPVITDHETSFEIGKMNVMQTGKDLTIIACGQMVHLALEAASQLQLQQQLSIQVINCHTIKPLDQRTLLAAAQQTNAFVTAEEHQLAGGLGSAISEWSSQNYQLPIEMVGVNDTFGESGSAAQLFQKYNLTTQNIIAACLRCLDRKQNYVN